LQVMISTLHKEMGMMQAQLNKFKEAACEVNSLRAEIHSLAGVLDRKVRKINQLLGARQQELIFSVGIVYSGTRWLSSAKWIVFRS
jgi:capsule polysaccharide export protein KpsE/RkpR